MLLVSREVDKVLIISDSFERKDVDIAVQVLERAIQPTVYDSVVIFNLVRGCADSVAYIKK